MGTSGLTNKGRHVKPDTISAPDHGGAVALPRAGSLRIRDMAPERGYCAQRHTGPWSVRPKKTCVICQMRSVNVQRPLSTSLPFGRSRFSTSLGRQITGPTDHRPTRQARPRLCGSMYAGSVLPTANVAPQARVAKELPCSMAAGFQCRWCVRGAPCFANAPSSIFRPTNSTAFTVSSGERSHWHSHRQNRTRLKSRTPSLRDGRCLPRNRCRHRRGQGPPD